MKIKTFTALITVAVESDTEMPDEFAIGDAIRTGLQPEDMLLKDGSVITCHASVIGGDMIVEPTTLVMKSESRTLGELFDIGCRINTVKAQHALLRSRVEGGVAQWVASSSSDTE